MLGTRHSFLFLTVLLAVLVSSPEVGSAQANEAPIINTGPIVAPSTTGPYYGSATGPISSPLGTRWEDWQSCSGLACLSSEEKAELNALCDLTGAAWQNYELCKKMAASLLTPQP